MLVVYNNERLNRHQQIQKYCLLLLQQFFDKPMFSHKFVLSGLNFAVTQHFNLLKLLDLSLQCVVVLQILGFLLNEAQHCRFVYLFESLLHVCHSALIVRVPS